MGSIPGLGRSPGGGHGNPLQYSCLENPTDRGAWRATVRRVAKCWTQLKLLSMCTCKSVRALLPLSLNQRSAWHPVGASCEPVIMQERKQKAPVGFSGPQTSLEGGAAAPGAGTHMLCRSASSSPPKSCCVWGVCCVPQLPKHRPLFVKTVS